MLELCTTVIINRPINASTVFGAHLWIPEPKQFRPPKKNLRESPLSKLWQNVLRNHSSFYHSNISYSNIGKHAVDLYIADMKQDSVKISQQIQQTIDLAAFDLSTEDIFLNI